MDSFDLFPGIDLSARRDSGPGCVSPIGRRDTGRRRPRVVRPRRTPTASALAELRGLLERQHAELRRIADAQEDIRELVRRDLLAIKRHAWTQPEDGVVGDTAQRETGVGVMPATRANPPTITELARIGTRRRKPEPEPPICSGVQGKLCDGDVIEEAGIVAQVKGQPK